MQIKLDGQWFQAIDAYGTSRTRVFWPTLKPIDKNGNYDRSVFARLHAGDKILMYTLLMDDIPVNQFLELGQKPVEYLKGAKLEITDKFFGKDYLIPWKINWGIAIADRPILTGVTQKDLKNNGFIVVKGEKDFENIGFIAAKGE